MDTLFELIPIDILFQTVNYMRYDDIPLIHDLSSIWKKLFDDGSVLTQMRQRVNKEFGFSMTMLNQSNMDELIRISKSKRFRLGTGNGHSLILKDGLVYGFGNNFNGQLGLGNTVNSNIPVLIPSLRNIISVSCGLSHSLVLTSDGNVYGFGSNWFGQLGSSDIRNIKEPKLIPSLYNIISISAGGYHSLALRSDGFIYGFGSNNKGQTGINNKLCIFEPEICPLSNIISISAGHEHSLALRNDGSVHGFGDNKYGQIGVDTRELSNIKKTAARLSPLLKNITSISAGYNYSLALKSDGIMYGFGFTHYNGSGLYDNHKGTPIVVSSLNNIIDISCGYTHSLALTSTGQAYSFTYDNLQKQTDNRYVLIPHILKEIKLNNVISVSVGDGYCLILTENNQVYGVGQNKYGELGSINVGKIIKTPTIIM